MNPPDVPQCCGDPSTCNDPCEPVKPLDDPHLQQIFGWAIEGAMASGYQNTNRAPEGHWLAPWWQRGRNAALANEQMVNGLTEAETAATASCAGLSRNTPEQLVPLSHADDPPFHHEFRPKDAA